MMIFTLLLIWGIRSAGVESRHNASRVYSPQSLTDGWLSKRCVTLTWHFGDNLNPEERGKINLENTMYPAVSQWILLSVIKKKNLNLLLFLFNAYFLVLSVQQPPVLGDLQLQPHFDVQQQVVLTLLLLDGKPELLQLRLQRVDGDLHLAELTAKSMIHLFQVLP